MTDNEKRECAKYVIELLDYSLTNPCESEVRHWIMRAKDTLAERQKLHEKTKKDLGV